MSRVLGPIVACALALANTAANGQAGAPPAAREHRDASTAGEPRGGSAQVPTADDICRALEQSAAENALPVEFFARVIWQESRFDVQAVSPKGAAGIAQFMPATASWHGLADPFDPVEALRHSAAYLRELLNRFGNLGLAAAAYNAGPARVSAWLTNHRALPAETHCGPCNRLDSRRMGIIVAARKRGDNNSARRALHPACQSDPRPETRAAAYRRLHSALGYSIGSTSV
jgi:soluble lytic murein transglycosylase-like protein